MAVRGHEGLHAGVADFVRDRLRAGADRVDRRPVAEPEAAACVRAAHAARQRGAFVPALQSRLGRS